MNIEIVLFGVLVVAVVVLGVMVYRLRERVLAWRKYQHIVDAESTAADLKARASNEAATITAQAGVDAQRVRLDADRLRSEAERVRAEADLHASTTAERTKVEVASVVEEARRSTEELSAEARRLEQTVEAMRNVLEGYGDRYVMPTFGLLDELGEEFGFDEAGKSLKAARERTRAMLKAGTAAACDYVEANRRVTAIAFVLDAFNGKVDTILSGVREDNVGTLTQRVKDAFTLVNHNGEAFRNARILPLYLATRLEELRWAGIVQELNRQRRDEQRAERERLREEEKAEREIKRAADENAREEKRNAEALRKAQLDLEKANGAQRAKFEARIAELEAQKLELESSRRAISNAQLTKAGHVYVISNIGSFGEHVYKVGMTRRWKPEERVDELGDASVPFEFDIHALIKTNDAPTLEHALHVRLVRARVNKVNPRREFFRVSIHEVRAIIEELRKESPQLFVEERWTLEARCAEHRETQKLEADPDELQRWVDQELRRRVQGASSARASRGGEDSVAKPS